MLLEKVSVVGFNVGDVVQIISGPLESFTGELLSVNDGAQKARAKVTMFGRTTEVEVEYVQIKKINGAENTQEETENN